MIRSARWWFATALAAAIVVSSARADQRIIVLLDRPRGAPIDRNAARIYAKWRVVPGLAATVDDTELQRLRNDPDVLSVEPDLAGSVTAVSNAESIGLNGELIGLSAVHALGYDGTGSTVAVLDTGVSPYFDLNGRIVEERCYCAFANNKGCCPKPKKRWPHCNCAVSRMSALPAFAILHVGLDESWTGSRTLENSDLKRLVDSRGRRHGKTPRRQRRAAATLRK